jgi:ABC-type antimicrobial peptide transport system permease subunit
VLRLVLRQGIVLTAAGLVLGLALGYMLTRFMRGLLYGVSATDPWTAVCVTALLAGISVLACCPPARRAVHVDPVTAIRAQ